MARSLPFEVAQRLGVAVARQGVRLIYGGGKVGLMGAPADEALAAGGEVGGGTPEALVAKKIAHTDLSRLHVGDGLKDVLDPRLKL